MVLQQWVRFIAGVCIVLVAPATSAYAAQKPMDSVKQREAAVRAVVELDAQVQQVLSYRPGSTVGVDTGKVGAWTAWVRQPGDTRNLMTLTLTGDPPRVVGRQQLPFDAFPPRMTQAQALAVARAHAEARSRALTYGGISRMKATAHWQDGTIWEVSFWHGASVRIRVDVVDATGQVDGVWTGHAIGWKMARAGRYSFGGDFNKPWVWYPAMLLFALVMLDRRRLLSMRTLDVGLLLSFAISLEFHWRGMIEWSVPLAWLSLALLGVRAVTWFVRGVHPLARSPEHMSWWRRDLPMWVLVVITIFAAGARYGINSSGSSVADVGYAGVAGARAVLHGTLPYGHMPSDNEHGDTYGPLNYLLYVPAAAIWNEPQDDVWEDGLPAAHAVATISDFLACLLIAAIGWRWASHRAGLMLAAGWMTFPFTGWVLCNNVNDTLVSVFVLASLLLIPRPWLRGGAMACAAAIKFMPLLAIPVLAHVGITRRSHQAIRVAAGAAIVLVACVAYLSAYPSGVSHFWRSTFGFQLDRSSPFSPWGLYGWQSAQRVAQVLLIGAACLVAFVPKQRDARQIAAGIAALLIGSQLVLQHWFYLYIPWFVGPVLVVLCLQSESRALPAIYARTHEQHDLELLED